MPKPLREQPDDKAVHEQVRELMRKAHQDRMAPVGIVFSQKGYSKALSQAVPGMQAFNNAGTSKESTHYLGLPFTVSTSLTQGDVLLDLVPGGSAEAKASRQANRDAIRQGPRRQPVTFRVDGLDPAKATMELAGEALTAPQICDLIQAWCKHQVRWGKNGNLATALDAVVRNHGRFE